MVTAYVIGRENGVLCRKFSNQYTTRPSDAEWKEAFLDPIDREGLGSREDASALADFVLGCKDGWCHSCGSRKL